MNGQTGAKVLVIGGAGQAGSIHVKNLLSIGCFVGCFDFIENKKANKNHLAKTTDYNTAIGEGYTHVILAVPDNILNGEATKVLNCSNKPQRVLIEKPGSLTSKDLKSLVQLAKEKSIPFFINYQRSFDPRVAEISKKVLDLVKNKGYELDYVSVYSCDKAQPPQKAHQILNQGCHDYAMLLDILKTVDIKITNETVHAQGVQWGNLKDTKFVRMGGIAEKTVFDVKMSRVSSFGTFTKMEINLSKKNEDGSMYDPIDINLQFPKVLDPNASWADTWQASFVESMKSFTQTGKSGISPVDAEFGVSVLEFAELALEKLKY